MDSRPRLPERRNPLLEEERAPSHEILVERRCLGQTELKVKPGQVGTSNATKIENLGTLDYAHLRVPLPKDLAGSGIFVKGSNRKWPEAYFLMRRSSDGFISATGMFKAAFPFAQQEEETAEKEYIKSLEEASSEEVAGNVWIDPSKALDLSEEYGIKLWIEALLDPEAITHGTSDNKRYIKSPPAFRVKDSPNGSVGSPLEKKVDGKRSTRGARSAQSESPSKAKSTPRKIATPRKSRKARTAVAGSDEQPSTIKEEEEKANGEVNGEHASDTVKVEVVTTSVPTANGEEEIETTRVQVEMPADHADLDLPEDTAAMLAKAREMVRQAEQIDGPTTVNTKNKRKAEEIIEPDEVASLDHALQQAPKRVRHNEVELRKEKVRRRALTGIAATLAVGALIPSILAAFPWS